MLFKNFSRRNYLLTDVDVKSVKSAVSTKNNPICVLLPRWIAAGCSPGRTRQKIELGNFLINSKFHFHGSTEWSVAVDSHRICTFRLNSIQAFESSFLIRMQKLLNWFDKSEKTNFSLVGVCFGFARDEARVERGRENYCELWCC